MAQCKFDFSSMALPEVIEVYEGFSGELVEMYHQFKELAEIDDAHPGGREPESPAP